MKGKSCLLIAGALVAFTFNHIAFAQHSGGSQSKPMRPKEQKMHQQKMGDQGLQKGEQRMRSQDPARQRDQLQDQQRERIYGYELMTEQERAQHQEQLRSMNTEAERNAFRMQHQEEMQRRARELGVDLPAPPRGKAQE